MKNRSLLPLLIAAVSFTAIPGNARAAVILAWDFAGLAGNEATVAATTVSAHLQTNSIVRGAGLIPRSEAGMFSARSWPTAGAGLAGALAGDDYMEWSIVPQATATYSLDNVEIDLWRVNSFFVEGPKTFHLRSSLDAFATDIGAPAVIPINNLTATFDLSTIPALQNANTAVTFRLYGYGTDGTDGWGGIGRAPGDDLVFNGTTTPEPSRATLSLFGILGVLLMRKRR